PLRFFVLFEAMQQPQEGRHLGPLGSIIVAEVIFGALASAPLPYGDLPIAGQLAGLSANYYPTNVFSEIPDIEDMAGLVEFTADIAGLKQTVPAFLCTESFRFTEPGGVKDGV